MAIVVRDLLAFAGIYFLVLLLVPMRWLPRETGWHGEWKGLLGVGLVALMVRRWPALLGVAVLVWLAELLWHRRAAGSGRRGGEG
jgi:hypothetical protein